MNPVLDRLNTYYEDALSVIVRRVLTRCSQPLTLTGKPE